MILNKNVMETDSFLDVNNDIYRILTVFNDCQELKKLLVYTDKKPLERKEDVAKDLRDTQIARVPLLPYDEDEGSLVVVSLVSADESAKSDTLHPTLAIDIFCPGNQWIINEGIRPLNIAHVISNLMKYELTQTGGVKYRCTGLVNCQLSDILIGYRMLYETIIDD
ncbi:MAG: hypothetical protein KBT03_05570 [Bacteroidales bacterium]|nr:hypothetical protein [Candidatus Scybalousia scybalohippi]